MIISALGGLSWQAVRALVPWASPALAYGLAVLASAALLVFFGYHLGAEGKGAAIAETNLNWMLKYNAEKDAADALRQRARALGAGEPATPDDIAARLRLCQSSPTCRKRD